MAGVRISHSPQFILSSSVHRATPLSRTQGCKEKAPVPGDEGARDGSSEVAAAMVAANEDARAGYGQEST